MDTIIGILMLFWGIAAVVAVVSLAMSVVKAFQRKVEDALDALVRCFIAMTTFCALPYFYDLIASGGGTYQLPGLAVAFAGTGVHLRIELTGLVIGAVCLIAASSVRGYYRANGNYFHRHKFDGCMCVKCAYTSNTGHHWVLSARETTPAGTTYRNEVCTQCESTRSVKEPNA